MKALEPNDKAHVVYQSTKWRVVRRQFPGGQRSYYIETRAFDALGEGHWEGYSVATAVEDAELPLSFFAELEGGETK